MSSLISLGLFAWWITLYIKYRVQSTSLHTFFSFLLLLKLVLVLFLLYVKISDVTNTVVYYDIAANKGIGSIAEGMVVVCVQLLYDTLFFFVYALSLPPI